MDLNSLMQQAQKMQNEMTARENELKQKEYTSSVASGVVKVTMNGEYQMTAVELNEDFVKNFTSDDVEILQDSLTLAVNEVTRKITAEKEQMLSSLAGGMSLPGMR